MIISEGLQKVIEEIVEKHFNFIGLKVVEMAEDAYYIGLLRPVHKPEKITLEEFRKQKAGVKGFGKELTADEKYVLKHIKQSAGKYVSRLKSDTKLYIDELVSKENIKYRNDEFSGKVRDVIEEGIRKRQSVKAIASKLRDSTKDLYRDFERVVSTEMTNAVNLGTHDAIVEKNRGKKPSDVYVYKMVKFDNALCAHCKSFYLNRGVPKVFKLSELRKNGSNYGKKSVDWKPTIEATHPRCRCVLLPMEEGWDFVDGELSFVGVGKEKWRKK